MIPSTIENQPSYIALREIISVKTKEVVLWAGAGLSEPAKLPLWYKLREDLIEACKRAIAGNFDESKEKKEGLLKMAEAETDLWESFSYIKKCLGPTDFNSTIRFHFKHANTCPVPPLYSEFWRLGIAGAITTNIDGLVARAFSEVHRGHPIIDFFGINTKQHAEVLRDTPRFIANLHGKLDSDSSWIFTKEDLNRILSDKSFTTFLETIFLKTTVMFCGASISDHAVRSHLDKITQSGLRLSGHFWLTSTCSTEVEDWAAQTGISLIRYSDKDNHSILRDVLADLRTYRSEDRTPDPVISESERKTRNLETLAPIELNTKPTNEIRMYLNKAAANILKSNAPDKAESYRKFRTEHEEGLYRSWFIKEGDQFFEYKIIGTIKKGAFGSLYKVEDKNGKAFALKVLHVGIKDDSGKLNCFRRGVNSMKILTHHKIQGMVPLVDAWEIPTSILMEYIEGMDLAEAEFSQYISTWDLRLKSSIEVIEIIISAHELDAQVLHRDLRPPNIIIENLDLSDESTKIRICDFDLSWHKDAIDTSIALESLNGYLAPEQLDPQLKKKSRSTYVDSFGFGMTLYFLLTGNNPAPYEQKNKESWREKLLQAANGLSCRRWHSLPRRFARMIYFLTKDEQSSRWSLQEARDELLRLQTAFNGIENITSTEMVAEELIYRTKKYKHDYKWDKILLSAEIEVRPGLIFKVSGDELSKTVNLCLDWTALGDVHLKSLRKYLPQKIEGILSKLQSDGWVISSKIFGSGSNYFLIEIPLKKFNQSEKRFNRSAEILDDLIDAYKIK